MQSFRLTNEEKENIKNLYLQGFSIESISRKTGRDAKGFLKKSGIHTVTPHREELTVEERGTLKNLYESGLTCPEIAIKLNLNKGTVRDNVKKLTKMRNRGDYDLSKDTFNRDFFNEVTECSSYTLGFIYADGCVSGKKLNITLNPKDTDILEKIKHAIGSSVVLKFNQDNEGYKKAEFIINSKTLTELITEEGVPPAKSMKPFEVKEKWLHSRHFWRGLIDGDGCVRMAKNRKSPRLPHLDLVGPYSMLEKYVRYCNSVLEKPLTTNINKHGNIFRVTTTGKNAKILIRHFYEDAEIYMDRKYNSAMNIINM